MKRIVKTKIFTHAAIVLLLAGNFLSCEWGKDASNGQEETSSCDNDNSCVCSIPPWVDKVIFEWLENGFYGRISVCDYVNGRGFLFEQFENNIDDLVYSFRTCDGLVLYEGEKKSIEDTYPELNIKNQTLLMRKFPSWWGQEETSDEFVRNGINPFTLPRVLSFTYRCDVRWCNKVVYICSYKGGIGFYLGEHWNNRLHRQIEFLDCNGNLLCTSEKELSDLEIISDKVLLELYITLNVNYLNR